MRLTPKDHRDAMVAMLANGNCPTSAARLAHAMHDVLSYLQCEPEAPVSHSERRDEATTPGLNDKLLALDVGALAKPQTVNQRVRELEATVKSRDNTVKQLKENIRLLRDERAELTRQLEEALRCPPEFMAAYGPEQAGVRKEDTQLPDEGWIEWIEWSGGVCPVAPGVLTEGKSRKGGTGLNSRPELWTWSHCNSPHDIIAYRVVKP